MTRAGLASACVWLAFCACAPNHALSRQAAASLAVASVDPSAARFEVALKERGLSAGSALIQKEPPIFHSISIQRGPQSCRVADEFAGLLTSITSVGTVDVAGHGDDELFVLNEEGGTGVHDEIMLLIDPRDCGVSGLDVNVRHQWTNPVTAEKGLGRFLDIERRPERQFLNAIKYRYGYLGQKDLDRDASNPKYAYYFWARDNGGIEDGPMRIRRYKGKPVYESALEKLADGPVEYMAQFKAGVVAYDSSTGQHYVLFHPDDKDHWSKVLKKAGPYLLIGTQGEGIAAVNLKDFHLKRFRFEGHNGDVKSIDVDGGRVIVNGAVPLVLPGL